ncbi:hypothetical protein [Flagellimonas crocea]|uniref:hypothetical protein n=1 Tax=Flagellimonas crocea TaxID=3067311 RepID=UPI00296FAF5D|nr:hypothetical protein [Muricauda sp. DH64]
MKKYLILILVLTTNWVGAQFIKEKAINAQIGYGLTIPTNSINNIADDGFFAQGEFILKAASWVEFRPYAGIILTSSNGKDLNGDPTTEKAESKAFLLGGKTRIKAPIPWVAPYAEIGIGTSIGKFRTNTFFDDIEKSGIIYHIPFSVGLELGRNNNVDLGLSYFYQPSVEQFAGAFAVGLAFPLNN